MFIKITYLRGHFVTNAFFINLQTFSIGYTPRLFPGQSSNNMSMVEIFYGSLYVTLCFVLCHFDFGVFTFVC